MKYTKERQMQKQRQGVAKKKEKMLRLESIYTPKTRKKTRNLSVPLLYFTVVPAVWQFTYINWSIHAGFKYINIYRYIYTYIYILTFVSFFLPKKEHSEICSKAPTLQFRIFRPILQHCMESGGVASLLVLLRGNTLRQNKAASAPVSPGSPLPMHGAGS